jgi:hypothetical protein
MKTEGADPSFVGRGDFAQHVSKSTAPGTRPVRPDVKRGPFKLPLLKKKAKP